jgi:hypothetical protein
MLKIPFNYKLVNDHIIQKENLLVKVISTPWAILFLVSSRKAWISSTLFSVYGSRIITMFLLNKDTKTFHHSQLLGKTNGGVIYFHPLFGVLHHQPRAGQIIPIYITPLRTHPSRHH